MRIDRYHESDLEVVARLRAQLWPEGTVAEHRADLEETDTAAATTFLARTDDGVVIGFAEATLRHDYVNGCDTSPVVFLEGIYIETGHRRTGAARSLCAAVEQWGRDLGCTELGSDALIDNALGRALHDGLGFEERERVVCYRKLL
ncbi:aminoglycoside 6'-N-acetyltransferase [Nocardia nepalensis]|uniref:aminoglycoside 6'-N-acetyltransferase n=1 Tax=Nocardia nepalensis TaxID=3375448 RepID=UPI003B67A376